MFERGRGDGKQQEAKKGRTDASFQYRRAVVATREPALEEMEKREREAGETYEGGSRRFSADMLLYGTEPSSRMPNQRMQALGEGGERQELSGKTGTLPSYLQFWLESESGMPMDDVRVHYNSERPGQLQALAYTQGTDIYLGIGQEKHLAHEAWHVVQQKQGRVRQTMEVNGYGVNGDRGLEREAEEMGIRALPKPRAGRGRGGEERKSYGCGKRKAEESQPKKGEGKPQGKEPIQRYIPNPDVQGQNIKSLKTFLSKAKTKDIGKLEAMVKNYNTDADYDRIIKIVEERMDDQKRVEFDIVMNELMSGLRSVSKSHESHRLVLGGGGAKGIAYGPALEEIKGYRTQIAKVVGSSAGALTGILYAAGVSEERIAEICKIPLEKTLAAGTENRYINRSPASVAVNARNLSKTQQPSNAEEIRKELLAALLNRFGEIAGIMERLSKDTRDRRQWGYGSDWDATIKGIAINYDILNEAKSSTRWQESRQWFDEKLEEIRAREDYRFADHNEIRENLREVGIDANMIDIAVTATKVGKRGEGEKPMMEGLRVFSNEKEGDSKVSMIDAAIVSGAFPLVFNPGRPKGDLAKLYADGGMITNVPTDVGTRDKHGRQYKTLALNLNEVPKRPGKRGHDFQGILGSKAKNWITRAFSETDEARGMKPHLGRVDEYVREHNRIDRDLNRAGKLLEVSIKPTGINTLSGKLPEIIKERALAEVKRKLSANREAIGRFFEAEKIELPKINEGTKSDNYIETWIDRVDKRAQDRKLRKTLVLPPLTKDMRPGRNG